MIINLSILLLRLELILAFILVILMFEEFQLYNFIRL